MRVVLPAVSLLVVAACASSGGTSTAAASGRPASETVRIQGVGSLETTGSGPSTSGRTLAFPIDQVWRVLPAAYDSLGIPVGMLDATTHTIGNDGFKARFRLGKTSLSRYLDCGGTQMGPSADSYEVTLAVHTHLRAADSTSTTAETSLEAAAKPVQFSQPPSRCSSMNVLEPRVAEVVGRLLGTAPR